MVEIFEEKKRKRKDEYEITIKPSESLKTITEIRNIREIARKGREIIARKKGEYIEPKIENRKSETDIKEMLELPPSKPKETPEEYSVNKLKDLKFHSTFKKIKFDKENEEIEIKKRNKKLEFEMIIRKMKKFLQ